MKTVIVNLFGAPGSGKSTAASFIYSMLKSKGVNAELVTEFAKDMVWEEAYASIENQGYVFGQQYQRISRLIGKVDVIITDSPLLLSVVFNKSEDPETFDKYVYGVHNRYNNINFLMKGNGIYNTAGRRETREEAERIEGRIYGVLERFDIEYTSFKSDMVSLEHMAEIIENAIEPEEKRCNICSKMLDSYDIIAENGIDTVVGYGSAYDGSRVRMRFCSECFDELIRHCSLTPLCEE